MAQSKNKTLPANGSVAAFLDKIDDPQKQQDCKAICEMMTRLSGYEPKLWGTMVGFGEYHYKYESGREGDFFRTGFSPRAQNISIYIMPGYLEMDDMLARLGKHKTGKSCLYIKRLSDIDEGVLEEIIAHGLAVMAERYPQ